jgi:ABC-2 type transport system permease protein
MSGNSAFEMVNERGWQRGLNNMLRSELDRWWKTRMWWIQCLIWGGMTVFMLGALLFGAADAGMEEALTVFAVFAGLFPAVGVVIIMQDALVGEKSEGTAAWVLSKPVTRPAFVLSKVIANSIGMLVTMTLLQSALGYAMFSIAEKSAQNPWRFLAAMVVMFVSLFFFLTLTLMLGTLFNGRGPVIGISLAILFLQQNLIGMLPALRFVLPWNLVIPLGSPPDSLVYSILAGVPVTSNQVMTGAIVLAEAIVFLAISLWRFNREEL